MTDVLRRPMLLPDLLAHALHGDPRRTAILLGDKAISYGELRDRISQFTQAYAALGLTPGTPVALLSANRAEVLYVLGAGLFAGTRGTALHPKGSLDDHVHVLEDGGIETLVVDPQAYGEHVVSLLERRPTLRVLTLGPGPVGQDLDALADDFVPVPLVPPLLDPDTPSSLIFTGGSTGRPKGVIGTYRSTATMTQIQVTEWQWPREIRHLLCTPMSHAAGGFWVPVLMQGGSLVAMPAFSPVAFFEAVQEHRITSTMLVPSMIYALLDHPAIDDYDLSSLETIFYGAAPISPRRLQQALERFGPVFFQFYGQSEAPMTICVMRKEEHDVHDLTRLASCGRPVPWVETALLDPAGLPVAEGEPGEICVRGPLVTAGYWQRPEETAALFAGGWLHTGDIARAGDDGFWTIVDRSKDLIITGGFNVFPREVEDVLTSHPDVALASVIGVPDEKWGEAVTAVVVPRDGATLDPEALIALVRERKGPVQAPKSVVVVDALPLTPVGKPDKPALRRQFWTGQERAVSG